ncbi:MAG: ABC transporter ATP-binding protein [Gammaproteobacteria bacterium]
MVIDHDILLRIEHLSKEVSSPEGLLTILDDVNFSIRRAEAVAIVGVSGSGKSTLIGLMAGLDTPTRGGVVFDGQDLNTLDEDGRARLRGRHVGFVFQSFYLMPSLNALENVMLPLELNGHADPRGAARRELTRVGLSARLGHYPHQLSGGEQQRVALARAFAPRPSVLFADEPTGNLDTATAAVVSRLLFALKEEYGTTLVLVTHDAALAGHCERHLTLANGRVLADRPAGAVGA